MARPALQIGYHDHCFDGVASSATFLRFYREKVLPGLAMDQVAFRGLAHRAGQIFGEEAFAGQENAVVDFRYTKDPRLTWWFDHHQSAFESPADEAHFRADRSGRKFWDPTAKSCTRFLARVCQERFGWDFSSLQELVDWAEVIDGAQFPDAKTAVELTQPAMQLMLLIEATKDPELCPRLIRELSQRPLSEVLREPWVLQPLAPLLARHRDLVRTVTQRLRVDGAVAEYDLADLGVDNVNKFIAYAADPSTVYTVAVTRGPNRSKVSLGSNPWKQDLRRHNLARIAERYGGGGQRASAGRRTLPSGGRAAGTGRTSRSAKARFQEAKDPPARQACSAASPASAPPCASTCSTHAQRALVGRTSALPRSRARRKASFASTSGTPAYGAPSMGVLRFATNGAQPNESGTMREISSESRASSARSSSVSPGKPTIRYSLSLWNPASRASSATRSSCAEVVRRSRALRRRSLAPSAAVVSVLSPARLRSETSSGRAQRRSARKLEMPTSRPSSISVRTSSTMRGWSVTAAPTRPTRRAPSGISSSTRSGVTVRMPPLVVRRMTQ